MAAIFTSSELVELGRMLRELREKKGASAAEIAHQVLGYAQGSHVAVTRLERGVLPAPRPEHLEKLALHFEVSLASLLPPEFDWDAYCKACIQISSTAVSKKPTLGVEAQELDSVDSDSPSESPLARSLPSGPQKPRSEDLSLLEGRIGHLRFRQRLSWEDYAHELRCCGPIITSSDVRVWEAGVKRPNHLQMAAIARQGQVTEHWLRTGQDDKDMLHILTTADFQRQAFQASLSVPEFTAPEAELAAD